MPNAPESPSTAVAVDDGAVQTDQPSLWRRLGPAGFLGALWACLPAIGGIVLLSMLGPISEWLRAQGSTGIAIYIGGFIVAAGAGLLPTYSQAVLAGWVFGVSIGFAAALSGFTGAALLGFAITRLVSQDRVEEAIRENPKATAIRNALIGRGFLRTTGIVTLLRIPPNSPFSLTNLALAGSGVRLSSYAIGTIIGMAPRTFVAVFFAAGAAQTGARDIQTFVSEGLGLGVLIVGVILMFIVLGVIGFIANHALERVIADPANASDPPPAH